MVMIRSDAKLLHFHHHHHKCHHLLRERRLHPTLLHNGPSIAPTPILGSLLLLVPLAVRMTSKES